MSKNDLTNRRLVSALTVGISAMMALASPITAYANGEATAPADDNPGSTTESTAASQSESAPAVTEQAEAQAEVVQEAAAGEEKQAEAGEDVLQSAAVEAGAAANEILSSDNAAVSGEAAGLDAEKPSEANKAIDNVIKAADAIVNDGENGDPSALSSLDAAAKKAAAVKQDLNDAGEAGKQADAHEADMLNEARAAFEDVKYATEKADHMVQDSIETQQKADALIESIKEAKTSDDANKAYDELGKLVVDTRDTLEAMKEFYDNLTKQYEAATANLKAAEEKMELAEKEFAGKLQSADEKTQEAKKDIEEAKQKVDNLAGALDVVGDKIDDAIDADTMRQRGGDNFSDKISGIKENRKVMETVVENYFLTQKLGIDVVSENGFVWEYIKDGKENAAGHVSADKQEYNYAQLTYYYRDKDGVVHKDIKYFNWDNAMKQMKNGHFYDSANATNGKAIVVFEKTQEEIDANDYLVKKYSDLMDGKHDADLKKLGRQGLLDVYAYEENGVKVFKAIDEINEMIATGEITKDSNGNYKLAGTDIALHRVVQNQNNLFGKGDCLIVGSDDQIGKFTDTTRSQIARDLEDRFKEAGLAEIAANSFALNEFIRSNATKDNNAAKLAGKYAGFETATEKAQQAVDVAQQEADKLSDAIDDLKGQKKRSVLAVDALGVEDVASYFGIEVDKDKADELNKMTVKEVLKELDNMLEESNKKVEAAQDNLTRLQENFGAAKADLDAALRRLNPRRPVTVEVSDGVAGAVEETVAVSAAAANRAQAAATIVAPEGTSQQESAPVVVDQRRAARQATENAQAASGDETASTTIEDGGVALSETTETETGEVKEDINAASISIEDEEPAKGLLEEGPVKEDNMSFWWLLVIALLGEAGREMYVKHKKKQEAKAKTDE